MILDLERGYRDPHHSRVRFALGMTWATQGELKEPSLRDARDFVAGQASCPRILRDVVTKRRAPAHVGLSLSFASYLGTVPVLPGGLTAVSMEWE